MNSTRQKSNSRTAAPRDDMAQVCGILGSARTQPAHPIPGQLKADLGERVPKGLLRDRVFVLFGQSLAVLLLIAAAFTPLPALGQGGATPAAPDDASATRPNILIAMADDQSFPHASAYGAAEIATPAFDAVARDGVLFHQAFVPAPGCSPMRAAFLTGQYIWQIGPAGTHASSFPKSLSVFPEQLETAGYFVGYTGKGWGPGNFKVSGRQRNPAGPTFSKRRNESPPGISATDYAANFEAFLEANQDDQPFCFWYGAHEPHRGYGAGLGKAAGIDPANIDVPAFLPDRSEIREDIADYYFEIQWFDQHLGRMWKTLEAAGQLENTVVIVTSDNGMPFPRAKANLYEYGIHMPLAISWPSRLAGGQTVDELVNLIDVTATIYDVAGVAPAADQPLAGRSLMPLMQGEPTGDAADWPGAVFSGRERHSSSRFNTLSYPCRCIRTNDYLYIRNYTPERWPAGTPRKYASVTYDEQNNPLEAKLGPPHGGYHDIDACPSLTFLIDHRDEADVAPLFQAAVAKRPAEELYAIGEDPGCLINLAESPEHAETLQALSTQLSEKLRQTGDLRETDPVAAHVWETYPRYSPLRWFPKPEWAEENPDAVPTQIWLEERRPRVEAIDEDEGEREGKEAR